MIVFIMVPCRAGAFGYGVSVDGLPQFDSEYICQYPHPLSHQRCYRRQSQAVLRRVVLTRPEEVDQSPSAIQNES
jgi:hypothetical protein